MGGIYFVDTADGINFVEVDAASPFETRGCGKGAYLAKCCLEPDGFVTVVTLSFGLRETVGASQLRDQKLKFERD